MDETGIRHAKDAADEDRHPSSALSYWAGGIVLAFALIVVCLAWFAALLLDQDRSARQSARLIASTARALEQENRELRGGVVKLTASLEKWLAAGERSDATKVSTPLVEEAPPAERRTRSPLEGKSFIRRAGM